MNPENWPEPDGHAMRVVESTAGYTISQMGYAWSEKQVREIVRMEVEACAQIALAEYDMRSATYNNHTPSNKRPALTGIQAAASIHQSIRARLKENKDAD